MRTIADEGRTVLLSSHLLDEVERVADHVTMISLQEIFVSHAPLTTTFMYCLAVFSYGLSGDLAARQSMYPARMFALPVTTTALAGWPMLYGTSAVIVTARPSS